MRSDRQMMDLILSRAREDDRVLAAYLKGSRANPPGIPGRLSGF